MCVYKLFRYFDVFKRLSCDSDARSKLADVASIVWGTEANNTLNTFGVCLWFVLGFFCRKLQ